MKHKSKIYPAEKAGALQGKVRKLFHNPRKIFAKYVRSGMNVLDFGCGPGMFSIEMAEMGARVISADLQQEMLDKLKDNIKNTKFEKSIVTVNCTKNDIKVSEIVDFILAFYVVHEVSDKNNLFSQFKAIMKENSFLYIIEPLFHVSKNQFEETLAFAEENGFEVVEKPKIFLSRAAVLKKSG